jgi:hypothetical protein
MANRTLISRSNRDRQIAIIEASAGGIAKAPASNQSVMLPGIGNQFVIHENALSIPTGDGTAPVSWTY